MFFLDFAAFCAVCSPSLAGFTQANCTSPTKECFIPLGEVLCLCTVITVYLTLVKLSWIRFSFSKQQICDLFLKWCILFQSNFAPCLPFCSFVYLWTVLQVYKWTELRIASYYKDTRTFLAKILLSHFSLALHVVPPLLPTAMSA